MNRIYAVAAVAVVSLVTVALRFTPFLLFRKREPPPVLTRIGRVLPYAVMAMLVVYCMKGISFSAPALWAPQIISASVTAALYLLRRNTLLSIVGGTVCCMILTQFVF